MGLFWCTAAVQAQEASSSTEGGESVVTPAEELAILEKLYQEKIAEEHAPIISRYLATLESLETTYLNTAKLEEAKKVRREIDWVKSKSWTKKDRPVVIPSRTRDSSPSRTPTEPKAKPFKPGAPGRTTEPTVKPPEPPTVPPVQPTVPPPSPPIAPPPVSPPTPNSGSG